MMRSALTTAFCFTLFGAFACGQSPAVKPAASPVVLFDTGAGVREITLALDDFHDAAARSDEGRYFSHFARSAVFLGTDMSERWNVDTFRAYAHPRFAEKKGWVFHSERRVISFSHDGSIAWFDEDLRGEKLGPSRGSGVFIRENGVYLLTQYNLALTIPNEKFSGVRALLDEAPPPPDLQTRYKAAYKEATHAAEAGDLKTAKERLETFVAEAKTKPDDDLEFWLHNALTWVHWSLGDLDGALEEVEQAKGTLDHSILPEEKKRELRLHEKWDRSYLLLEKAEAATTTKKALLADADQARKEYDELATSAADHDGMAVLEAFFALNKGNAKGAATAAKRIDVDKDSDLQDLYVISRAFDAIKDAEAAARVRLKICDGRSYLMKPLILRAFAHDNHSCPSTAESK